MYNCSSDHPGTEALIATTLLSSGISKIEFQPLSDGDLDLTVQQYGVSTGLIYHISSGDVGVHAGAKSIYGLDGVIDLYENS